MTEGRVLDILDKSGGIESAVEHVAHPKHQPSCAAICLGLGLVNRSFTKYLPSASENRYYFNFFGTIPHVCTRSTEQRANR